MTPRPVKDPDGLTAWTTPEAAGVPGDKIQIIDANKLDNVKAVPDADGHVSLTPGSSDELAEWAATRDIEGVVHPYTREVQDAIVGEMRLPKT